MFLEIELKLTIDTTPENIELLFNHPLLKNTTPFSEELISRYFDSPNLCLWQQGLSLRTREAANCTIQTLKTAGKQLGQLHHRHEWDQPIGDTHPNIHAFEDKEVSKKLEAIIRGQPLVELFHTRFNRTQWNLETEDSTKIELVLDQGSINTEMQQMPLHEIELELKQGDAKQLETVAAMLKKTILLKLETRSKAERGYTLYTSAKDSILNG